MKQLFTLVAFSIFVGVVSPVSAQIDYVIKDAPKPGVIGKIGGKEIPSDSIVDLDRMAWLKVLSAQYEYQLNAFTEIMLRRVVAPMAEAEGITMNEYVDKRILSDVTLSDGEIDAFLMSRGVAKESINENLRAQGRNVILSAKRRDKLLAYLNQIAKDNKVELYLRPPDVRLALKDGNFPSYGPAKAPVTVTIFSDFECPACANTLSMVNRLKNVYTDTVRFVFHHSPLNIHPNAIPAATASVCAFRQKPEAFWPYHDLLYQNQASLNDTNYAQFAIMIGLDVDAFKKCLAEDANRQFVVDDMNYTQSLGIFSTPTFLINGRPLDGIPSYSTFAQLIEDELKLVKSKRTDPKAKKKVRK